MEAIDLLREELHKAIDKGNKRELLKISKKLDEVTANLPYWRNIS